VDHVQLTTSDGHSLAADIVSPADSAWGSVALCHPHPEFGGNRFNEVIQALSDACPRVGLHTIRFDFRHDHGGGGPERLDVVAALDELEHRFGELPLHLVGYSFGATVALSVNDARVDAVVAIAPPLPMMPVESPAVDTLVVVPVHDQFCPPDVATATTSAWPRASVVTLEMADHFMGGRAREAAEVAAAWLSARRPA
jgi:alpha/beta superfamily hydrolase